MRTNVKTKIAGLDKLRVEKPHSSLLQRVAIIDYQGAQQPYPLAKDINH
jgi:hypothetical protein